MFAVIKTGGKQYKVATDNILEIEKLEAEAGDMVTFDEVLMLGGASPIVGAPFVEGASVSAEVLEQKRGPKTIKFVKRRRKHSSQRRRGHRQSLTVVKIAEILAAGQKPTKKAASKPKAAPKADKSAEKAPAKKAKVAKPAAKKAEAKSTAAETGASEGTKPANLLTEAQGGKADDLKLISGVGPKLENLLHENGVFHFWQVAEWTKSEIDYMDDQLSFKGRIERDDWIKQATALAKDAK